MTTWFWQMVRSDPMAWARPDLDCLTNAELAWISRLLGIPFSGTKSQRVERILDALELRVILAACTNDPEPLAATYRLKELQAFAKRAGTYRWLNKRGVAAGLLTWRNQCRRDGQRALDELWALDRQAAQLRMRF
jgi:hypothetical protein